MIFHNLSTHKDLATNILLDVVLYLISEPEATSVCGLTLHVYEALSYKDLATDILFDVVLYLI